MVASRWRLAVARYLELLRAARKESMRPEHQSGARAPKADLQSPVSAIAPATDAEACRLAAAGYWPKVSFGGKTIWQRPDTGFWVSQEMALHLLKNNNVREDSIS
jgi:hypothetical protein